MTLRSRAVVLLLVLALVSAPVTGTVSASLDGEAGSRQVALDDRAAMEAWLDETMADQLERHHVPGAAVVVVRDGEPFLSKGYGYADLERERPVDPNETVFGIGSTSKLVTWTAVMQGVEDGRLALDRDVNEYLTDSPVTVPDTYAEPVTLEHLGTHTAGFEDAFGGTLVATPADLRPLGETLAENQPARVRPPGEFVAYSNYGTALAGHVVAEQYDTTFTDHVESRIFEPLAMDSTTYDQPVPDRLQDRLATGYVYQDGRHQPGVTQTWGLAPQGGAMRSTATDMGRFMLAYLNEGEYDGERVLEAETVSEMHRRHVTKAPEVPELNGMGYGFIEMDRNGQRIVGHWGTTASFMSLLALFPEDDTGLFVVYNSPGGNEARFELLQAFVDRYYPRSATPVVDPPTGAAERATQLAGDYRSLTVSETTWHRVLGVATRTFTVEATPEGYLTTRRLGAEPRAWVERRPGVYEEVGGRELLVFRFDESGRATHLFFGDFGPSTYERVPWYETLTVVAGVLGGGVLAFLSGLVLWGGAPLWRRLRDRPGRSDRERAARWLLGLTSLLWLAVLVVFGLAWVNFNAAVASPSLALRIGLVLPYLGLLLTAGAAVAAVFAWRDGYWTLPLRLHYAAVTVLAILVAWQLSLLGILSL